MSIESLRHKLKEAGDYNRNQLTMITYGEIEDAIIEYEEGCKTNPIEPQRVKFNQNRSNASAISSGSRR